VILHASPPAQAKSTSSVHDEALNGLLRRAVTRDDELLPSSAYAVHAAVRPTEQKRFHRYACFMPFSIHYFFHQLPPIVWLPPNATLENIYSTLFTKHNGST